MSKEKQLACLITLIDNAQWELIAQEQKDGGYNGIEVFERDMNEFETIMRRLIDNQK